MNIKIIKAFVTAAFLFVTTVPVYAQLVAEKFDKLDMSENFDTSSGMWTFLANNENLFLVQDGEYILNRKSIDKPYAVIANSDYNEPAFKIVTSMKIERAADQNGSIGLIFMAQNDGQGGFIFEMNTSRQYRLRQIASGTYRYLTGEAKSGGWVKSSLINEVNVYNLLEIKTANRNYDVFLNNTYLLSFNEISYKSGRFGLIVGPGSRAKVDFIYLFSVSKYNPSTSTDPKAVKKDDEDGGNGKALENASPDIIELAESIIKLKSQINKLQAENEDQKKMIDVLRSTDRDDENESKAKDKTITLLQKKIEQSDISIDSLQRANKDLLRYKEMVGGNENSDIIISLSKTLKAEKEKNKVLVDSILILKSDLQKTKATPKAYKPANSTTPVKKDSTQTKSQFVLPREN